MGKDRGKLSSTHLIEIVLGKVRLVTEGGELSDGLEEVVICIDLVSLGEASTPVVLTYDCLHTLHIVSCKIVRIDRAIDGERGGKPMLD